MVTISEPQQTGRASEFTQEMGDAICEAVATNGRGIRRICQQHPEFPHPETIFKWRRKFPEFDQQYTRAKIQQLDVMEEDCIEISDDSFNDTIETESGERPNSEWIARSKLRVDTRKWLMSKLAPKKYGDKTAVEHSGEVKLPVVTTLDDLRTQIQAAKEKMGP